MKKLRKIICCFFGHEKEELMSIPISRQLLYFSWGIDRYDVVATKCTRCNKVFDEWKCLDVPGYCKTRWCRNKIARKRIDFCTSCKRKRKKLDRLLAK